MNINIQSTLILSVLFVLLIFSCKKKTSTEPSNNDPTISSFTITPTTIPANGVIMVKVTAADEDEDEITYSYNPSGGNITGAGSSVNWTAPNTAGTYSLEVTVTDDSGGEITDSVTLTVTAPVTQLTGFIEFAAGHSGDLNGAMIILYNSIGNYDAYASYMEVENNYSGRKVPYSITGLAAGNDYYLEVWKDCDNDGNMYDTGDYYGVCGLYDPSSTANRPVVNTIEISELETTRKDAKMYVIQ